MPSGLQLVSTTATIGMPSFLASAMAICSLLVSITNSRSGRPPISLMPPSDLLSLSRSRVSCSTSFLVRPLASPASISSSCFRRRIDWEMVFQLVSVPPSQRWLMKYCAERLAASAMPSEACRLVPTNSTRPPPATTSLILTSA